MIAHVLHNPGIAYTIVQVLNDPNFSVITVQWL